MIEDVAFLVTDAALHGNVAEDAVNGCSERLAAVQDDEDALVAVQATGLVRTRHGPSGTGRGAEDRHLKCYELRDNLPIGDDERAPRPEARAGWTDHAQWWLSVRWRNVTSECSKPDERSDQPAPRRRRDGLHGGYNATAGPNDSPRPPRRQA